MVLQQKRNALVIGGAGGIGAACCEDLAFNGWHIIVADNNAEAANRVAMKVNGSSLALDVTNAALVETAAERLDNETGGINALVNCAALIPGPRSPEATPIDKWDEVINVGFRGTYITARAFGGRMAKRSRGAIVLMASIAGMGSTPLHDYGPMKAAIINLGSNLAVQWGRRGVRVNVVSPGATRTPTIEASYARGERNPAIMERQTAFGRLVRTSEVAAAVTFLLSDAASGITGANLVVDCGTIAAMYWNLYGGVQQVLDNERSGA